MRQTTFSTFSTNFERAGDRAVVRVSGELDMTTAPALRAALEAALKACVEPASMTVLVDMSDVTFMDCSGLNTIIACRRDATAPGATLSLVRPSWCVQRVVGLTNTSTLLAA
jgi:anti-anti-sigma factor